jgi:hypothetical protein
MNECASLITQDLHSDDEKLFRDTWIFVGGKIGFSADLAIVMTVEQFFDLKIDLSSAQNKKTKTLTCHTFVLHPNCVMLELPCLTSDNASSGEKTG